MDDIISPSASGLSCAAVIVAGGRSSRLGNVPKASLSNGSKTLLDCALEAAVFASPRVVVGPETLPIPENVLLTREDPPFSGPAAAIHAGLECIAGYCTEVALPLPRWCLILGVDTPRIAPAVRQLMHAAAGDTVDSQGFWGVAGGAYQPLVGIYRFENIRSVFASGTTDASVRSFLRRLHPGDIELSSEHTADVDTWEQAEQLGYTTSLWSSY